MAKKKKDQTLQAIRDIVNEAISTGQQEFLVEIIHRLQEEYRELAKLSTFGQYNTKWTHKQTLDYITKEV